MKRVILMLAATAAFACMPAFAQAGGGSGGGTAGSAGQSSSGAQASGTQSSGVSANQGAQTGSQDQGMAGETTGKHHKKSAKGSSGKMANLTGCISASPDSNGMYTLSNGKYKSGVEIGPTDKVKDHAGHQVALKGNWNNGGATGENGGVAASTSTSGKSFNVDSVKHISDTCKEAPGGGTMGHKGHSKKSKSDTGTGSTTTPPPSR